MQRTVAPRKAASKRPQRHNLLALAVIVAVLAFAGMGMSLHPDAVAVTQRPAEASPLHTAVSGLKGDSAFSHKSAAHGRLPCLLCHQSTGSTATPVRSIGHTPCAGCHVQQFTEKQPLFCGICHKDGSGQSAEVKPFPGLMSFGTSFSHATHVGSAVRANCATCHRAASNGRSVSIPAGISAHMTCFKCHASQAQSPARGLSSCNVCHQQGTRAVGFGALSRQSPRFSHTRHTSGARLACSSCHRISQATQLAKQIVTPSVLEHRIEYKGTSCRTCHNGTAAFGDEKFSDCRRCHAGQTFAP